MSSLLACVLYSPSELRYASCVFSLGVCSLFTFRAQVRLLCLLSWRVFSIHLPSSGTPLVSSLLACVLYSPSELRYASCVFSLGVCSLFTFRAQVRLLCLLSWRVFSIHLPSSGTPLVSSLLACVLYSPSELRYASCVFSLGVCFLFSTVENTAAFLFKPSIQNTEILLSMNYTEICFTTA